MGPRLPVGAWDRVGGRDSGRDACFACACSGLRLLFGCFWLLMHDRCVAVGCVSVVLASVALAFGCSCFRLLCIAVLFQGIHSPPVLQLIVKRRAGGHRTSLKNSNLREDPIPPLPFALISLPESENENVKR